MDNFFVLGVDKNRPFLTPFPPLLVYVVIEWPLKSKLTSILGICVDRNLFVKHVVMESAVVLKKYQNMIKMTSDFASSVLF